MADNFDTLSIQITASASKAIAQVNQLADALVRLNGALKGVDASNLESVAGAADKFNNAISSFRVSGKKIESIATAFQQVGQASGNIAQTTDNMEGLADAAKEASENTSAAAQNTGMAAKTAGGSASSGFSRFGESLKRVSKSLANIGQHSNRVSKGIKSVSKASRSASITSKGLAKELLRVSKMMKLMITRMILRKIITGVADGFKNLAQYSSQVNASMSLLWNSFRQLGNSIAAAVSPLLNAFAPALNYIIQLAIKAVNAINQLFSALVGFGTWTRAKTLTDDYAKSLDKANGSAKELKKTVLGFDELNQLQDNKDSGGGLTDPSDMFETLEVGEKWKKLADKIKDYWEKLITPIKKAWANAGDYVKKAWTKAFENIKTLVMDIADDFFEVWNQPETVAMLENIFKIIGNIGMIIANLADSFDRAWKKGEVGKRIFEDIRDICAEIVEGIEEITASWAEWADEVDFSPLLESLEGWLSSLKRPIDAIMGVISDLNEDFIQPLATWLIEKGIPDLIQVFTDFNNKVDWETIRERLDRVWKALEPFAETIGEGLILFVGRISDALADFLNSEQWDAFIDTLIEWMNNVDAEDVANGLELICAALLGYKAITFLGSVASGIAGLGASCASLAPLAAAAALITGLGISIKLLRDDIKSYKDYLGKDSLWDALFDSSEETAAAKRTYAEQKASNPYMNGTVSQDVKDTADDIAKWLSDSEKRARENRDRLRGVNKENRADAEQHAVENRRKLQEASEGAQRIVSDLAKNLKDKVDEIRTNISNTVTNIKGFFEEKNWTFDGISEGLRKSFESAKDAIKGIWNNIADTMNGTHSFFGHSYTINLPKLYANGGFPSQGSMFIAGESGAELVGNINGRTAVANSDQITTGIASAVYSAIMSANGSASGGQYINNTIEIDGVAIARAVTKGQEQLNRRYNPTMA